VVFAAPVVTAVHAASRSPSSISASTRTGPAPALVEVASGRPYLSVLPQPRESLGPVRTPRAGIPSGPPQRLAAVIEFGGVDRGEGVDVAFGLEYRFHEVAGTVIVRVLAEGRRDALPYPGRAGVA
jgi:hypothetical protein